jgi:uncharacterized protein (DUF58 family)
MGLRARLTTLARRFGGARFRWRREGVYWVAVAAALLLIGLIKGINLLALLACLMIGLWVLNAFVAGRRLRGLEARRRLPVAVFAGTPFTLEVALTSQAGAQAGIRIDDRGPAHHVSWYVPRVGARETIALRAPVTLPSRGRCIWQMLAASSSHPFGFVQRTRLLLPAEESLVLPALGLLHRGKLRRHLARCGVASEGNRQHARRHPASQAEFHGLRAFRSGDSPRWIHWRTSARCAELMVREFEDVPTDHLILVVDLSVTGAGDGGAVEDLLSLAASVCWEWCRQKGDRLVLAVDGSQPAILDGVTSQSHAIRMLESLAVQEPCSVAGAGDDFLDRLLTTPLPRAPVLYLSLTPTRKGRMLAKRLRHAVLAVDAGMVSRLDFYERPTNDAR